MINFIFKQPKQNLLLIIVIFLTIAINKNTENGLKFDFKWAETLNRMTVHLFYDDFSYDFYSISSQIINKTKNTN